MFDSDNSQEMQQICSVSDLNLSVRALLDEAFDTLWIQGEISNFACPRSNHWYFTLKDSKAQIKCAMFRGMNMKVGFQPESGMEVILYAKVSLYPERGDYQLIAQDMRLSGEGELQKAFEALKTKLEKEGLFSDSHKKSFPLYPRKIAIVTSATGAALKDILSVLERRYPILEVIIIPSMVQGVGAAVTIVNAIKSANKLEGVELIILARGGGSLEDLWCFNEESVAKAIYGSKLPIITGIGHESDFTIADYVADCRAPTPSAAAETISPNHEDLKLLFGQYQTELYKNILRKFNYLAQKLDHAEKGLISPLKKLEQQKGALLQLLIRSSRALMQNMRHQQGQYQEAKLKINTLSPLQNIVSMKAHLKFLLIHQSNAVDKLQTRKNTQAKELMRTLHAMSPLATLDRGYSITRKSNKIESSATSFKVGDLIETTFKDGKVTSNVNQVLSNKNTGQA